jgi:hypothetical protein
MMMLSDILPTGYEYGVLNGAVKPGDTVAVISARPRWPVRVADDSIFGFAPSVGTI